MVFLSGLVEFSFLDYLIYVLIVTHITIISVTVYLHRYSAHRALELHPILQNFFRFWLWLTTGMNTKAWTAIHRKHHAKCETIEDPHSPIILGLKKVLFEGAELYKLEAVNEETLKRYGAGTPNDWLENNLYKHSILGVSILLIINFILFGFAGITIWAIQMIWIPFWAAGVINGVAHFWGYKNFKVNDASSNIFPIGIIIGGEELHNNHHAFGTSAKLSNKWYEFDIGWFYISLFKFIGLAKVKKVAPRARFYNSPKPVTEKTLDNLILNRFDFLRRYSSVVSKELNKYFDSYNIRCIKLRKNIIKIISSESLVPSKEQSKLISDIVHKDKDLSLLLDMKNKLINLWEDRDLTKGQLIESLKEWCDIAESSDIISLRNISFKLRSYSL